MSPDTAFKTVPIGEKFLHALSMHTTWKHLAIQNEQELKDVKRLKRVHRARSRGYLMMTVGFALGAFVSFALGAWFLMLTVQGFLHWSQGFLAAVAMLGLGAVFIFGMRMFFKEKEYNLLRAYFKNPQNFIFIEGEIIAGAFSYSGSRASSKIIAEGIVKSEGKVLHSIDHFSSFIWPFITREEDSQIQEGDEWYELKGKRVFLPVKAMFLVEKKKPQHAALIAIDKDLVTDAVQRAEKDF